MSPISGDTSWASSSPPGNILMARVFNNTETSEVMELDAHQVYVLRVLATTASSFSVASAIVAFYWFVKMRRSFRHQ
jgi:G protein-coupled receptor GPR1